MATASKRIRPFLLLTVLSLILYLPVMSHAAALDTDFGKHIRRAIALPEISDHESHVTHVLYHSLFLLIYRGLPTLELTHVAAAAILIFMLPVPLIAFAFFKKAAGDSLPDPWLMAFSLGLTIMSPVTIWTNVFMIGYINPIVYHNPTVITVRLFVIPISLLALRIYQSQAYRSLNQRVYVLLLCAVLVLMSTLAKQSFTIALLPGCCLYASWRLLRRRHVDWFLLAIGICLPGVFMLAFQYLLYDVNSSDGSAVAFGFLTFMQQWIPSWRIPIQLLLSLVFPIGVYLRYRENARRHLYLNMSWVLFAVAAGITYVLYETGPRIEHGNFIWNSYSAIFLLMFASALFLMEQHAHERQLEIGELHVFGIKLSRSVAFLMLLFGLHVVSGITYYMRFLAIEHLY